MRRRRAPRWSEVTDPGLQQERTALAWERTAIAVMVVGTLTGRLAAGDGVTVLAAAGLVFTGFGGLTLLWAGQRYDDLHGPITEGTDVVHPRATQIMGWMSIALTATAAALGALLSLA